MEAMNKEAKEHPLTDGGYRYEDHKVGDATYRIRGSITSKRLEEDGETFEEYKLRLKLFQNYQKKAKQGSLLWPSKKLPTERDLYIRDTDPANFHKTEEYRRLQLSNLGTLTKEKVMALEEILHNPKSTTDGVQG